MREFLIGLTGSFLLAGCGVDPAPGSRDPAPWQPAVGVVVPTPSPASGPWSRDAVLAQVRASHPGLLQARARVQEAQARLREARAAWYPVLGLSQGYGVTDNPGQAFGMLLNQHRLSLGPGFDATPGATQNWRTEARVDLPLWVPGRGAQIAAADAASLAAKAEAQAAEQELLGAALAAWFGVRTAHAMARVADQSVAVVAERLAQTEARRAAGAALPVDVLRLEARQAAARAQAAAARLAVQHATSALAVLAGMPAETPLALDLAEAAPALPIPGDLAVALERARAGRQELRAAQGAVHAAEQQRDAARAAWQPSLVAFGAYDIDGRDPRFDTRLDSWGAGVELRFLLSAATAPRSDAAEARLEQMRRGFRAVELGVGRQVHDAWQAIAAADETVREAEAGAAAADAAWRNLAAAQDAGGATTTDVLEAEDARRQAQVRKVAATAERDLSRVRLLAAMGDLR